MSERDQQQSRLQPEVSRQDHIQGDAHAPVTLVEYGDFECPDCGQAYPIVKELQQRLHNSFRFVYRHYPLPQHSHAEHAAEAAEAAGAQGKFWEMHDYLFEHQRALSDRHLLEGAKQLELDTARFESEMEQGIYAGQVAEDLASGDQSGVEGTPTFFINGRLHSGDYDVDSLLAAIQSARG